MNVRSWLAENGMPGVVLHSANADTLFFTHVDFSDGCFRMAYVRQDKVFRFAVGLTIEVTGRDWTPSEAAQISYVLMTAAKFATDVAVRRLDEVPA